jgi:hypothetical protein
MRINSSPWDGRPAGKLPAHCTSIRSVFQIEPKLWRKLLGAFGWLNRLQRSNLTCLPKLYGR